ncbi:hypothetical protein Adt_45180 [Abeliophyllum distichum]|uniref:Uncharacterized protein n=1 Tax=Abeliophyllum distichum TaxID=126358 RepID=A0ABD1PCZ8_9LAMI
MHNPAFKCVREWDAFASAPDVPKDPEGLWPGSDSGYPKWMESNGEGHVLVVSALLWHGNAFVCVLNHLLAEEVAEEEGQGGGSGVLRWIREGVLDQRSPVYRSKGPRFWRPAEDTSQRKVIEDLSREGNRAEVTAPDVVEIEDTCVPEEEVPLKRKRKGGGFWIRTLSVQEEVVLDSTSRADPVSGGSGVGPFDSRKKLRELIEPPGSRISDDTLRNVPFFPSIGAQAVKKYLTPKWKEFASHGEREDVLEAGLAAAVRVTSLQMKVLGSFGLADLRESDSNILQLTKQLVTANAAQKVAKKRLLSESESRNLEFQRLRGELEVSEKGRTEAEAKVTRLLGEKKEMEAKLENVEADFIANFHNTEAYTNFADYFARVGHQEVLAALRTERPDLDLEPLGDKFPPPEADEEEGS